MIVTLFVFFLNLLLLHLHLLNFLLLHHTTQLTHHVPEMI